MGGTAIITAVTRPAAGQPAQPLRQCKHRLRCARRHTDRGHHPPAAPTGSTAWETPDFDAALHLLQEEFTNKGRGSTQLGDSEFGAHSLIGMLDAVGVAHEANQAVAAGGKVHGEKTLLTGLSGFDLGNRNDV